MSISLFKQENQLCVKDKIQGAALMSKPAYCLMWPLGKLLLIWE